MGYPERACESCIWWGKHNVHDYYEEEKIILTPDKELKVKRCNYRPHPTVNYDFKSLFTVSAYVCSEWQKEAKNA